MGLTTSPGVAIPVPINQGGTAATTAYAAFDNLSIHGANIASASTVNLDTATGNLVDITGTTQINAITLAEGRARDVRFTGSLTLSGSASLILPVAVNSIITQAGDTARFRGYASGVVRCIIFQRFDGAALVGLINTAAPGVLAKSVGSTMLVDSLFSDDTVDARAGLGVTKLKLDSAGQVSVLGDVDDVGQSNKIIVDENALRIILMVKSGAGLIVIPNDLPTSDPAVAGALWRDAVTNIVKISV